MDKREACHRLAEMSEEINDLEENLKKIDLRLLVEEKSNREWYLERKRETTEKLEKCVQEHDEFINEYSDIIHS